MQAQSKLFSSVIEITKLHLSQTSFSHLSAVLFLSSVLCHFHCPKRPLLSPLCLHSNPPLLSGCPFYSLSPPHNLPFCLHLDVSYFAQSVKTVREMCEWSTMANGDEDKKYALPTVLTSHYPLPVILCTYKNFVDELLYYYI